MNRIFRAVILLSFAFIFCLTQRALAQAPNSLSGATLDYVVKGGTGQYETSGKYRVFVSNSGAAYTLLRLDYKGMTYGSSSYAQSTLDQGTLTLNDALQHLTFNSVLTYSSASGGTFYYGSSSFPGYEYGDFKMYSATAPTSIESNIFQMTVTSGTAPFRTTGSYRIVTPGNGYYAVQELSGSASGWRSYTYAPTNRTSGTFSFNGLDSATWGFAELTFASATNGVFVVRDNDWTGYQEGTFVRTNFYMPKFTRQPATQNVPVGTKVVFSASASGSGPIAYQWYKNDGIITGATAASYTIASAQSANAGSYRVTAKNVGGTVNSSTATLSVFTCSYTLSSNATFLNFTGGTGAVRVSTTSGCGWTASTTNSWLTITSANSGTTSATITFSASANQSTASRVGALNIAGKLFTVAQGGHFTPTNIAGKSFNFHITGGTNAPTTGYFVLSTSTSTTNTLRLIPLSTGIVATNANYTFAKTSSTTALLRFNGRAATLTFSKPTRGTFQIKNADASTQIGTFSMEERAADFNQDGLGDMVWQNSSGSLPVWLTKGTALIRKTTLRDGAVPSWSWTAFGSGDFNRDGHSDVLFQDNNRVVSLWMMNQTNWVRDVLVNHGYPISVGWKGVTAADFNEDQQTDILFQNDDGRLAVWQMNATNSATTIILRKGQSVGAGWHAIAATDLNGDRQPDILFQHDSGLMAAWLMNRTEFITSIALNNGAGVASGLHLVGASDFNFDGNNDLLWQKTDGTLSYWQMSGINVSSSNALFSSQPVALNLHCVSPK